MTGFREKSALVTGAGSGIGLAASLRLAERGYRVFAGVFEDEERPVLQTAADGRGVNLHLLPLDVRDPESIEAATQTVMHASGRIDVLVNSAGIGLRGFFEDLTEEEIRRVYDVNVFGSMQVARAVLPVMREAGRGSIVFLSSAGGRIPTMTISAYGSGKFAIEGFAECLRLEVAPFGIHVSLIEPGLVLTPHFTRHRGRGERAVDPTSPNYAWFVQHEALVDGILRRGNITPADVADAVVRAAEADRPRLRYVVGRGAKIMLAVRRLLPERLFDRIYRSQVIKRVTEPKEPVLSLNDLEIPGGANGAGTGA